MLLAIAAITAFVAILLSASQASARPRGMIDASGNPAMNGGATCAACHSGGEQPQVTLIGPTTVKPGETNRYTLQIKGGPAVVGGFNVSAEMGEISGPDANTQILEGQATHAGVLSFDGGDTVSWSFNWTAPMTAGQVGMFGAGNSANGADKTDGDGIDAASIIINVSGGNSGAMTGGGASSAGCQIPASGPWPPCATGGHSAGAAASSGSCQIPASGPWPPCATGGHSAGAAASSGSCQIPASGPWPACARGGAAAPSMACVVPPSGPWPACAR